MISTDCVYFYACNIGAAVSAFVTQLHAGAISTRIAPFVGTDPLRDFFEGKQMTGRPNWLAFSEFRIIV